MIQKIRFITFIDLIFLVMLGIAGSLGESGFSTAIYYLAFILPIFLGISYVLTLREQCGESRIKARRELFADFTLKGERALLSLPIIFLGIGAVVLVSALTSAVMAYFGKENASVPSEPFPLALLMHALVPAVLEELLFRFVPVKLLRDNPRAAILLSSLFFALAHANLFRIPYAAVAGAVLAYLYIFTGSILPCILMHLLNNTLSLISIYSCGGRWLFFTIYAAALLSAAFIAVFRKRYIGAYPSDNSGAKCEIGYSPFVFAFVSLTFAISALFA